MCQIRQCVGISENQTIFCEHGNHKQCYKAKEFNVSFDSVVAEGPISSKISARSANKWSFNGMEATSFQCYTT